MKINKYHGAFNVTRRTESVKYIVIHYVGAGTADAGNAKNNCICFSRCNRNASAHYFIDNGGIWEYADPKTERGQCMLKTICEQLGFHSLGYQTVEGVLESIGIDKSKVCTYCWTGKE